VFFFVHSPAELGCGMNYESAVEYVFDKNSELYGRLAGREERVSAAIKRIIDKNEELYRWLAQPGIRHGINSEAE
jgi:hypothetical protein